MKKEIQFPDPNQADNDGLVSVGGELSPEYLLAAYAQGIFPWFNEGEPILWWSPNPRMVLYPDRIKISRSLDQRIKSNKFQLLVDEDFRRVIEKCSKIKRRNQSGTWITSTMIEAYTQLHKLGFAHSVQVYHDEELAGGLYGISLGRVFFGESMFFEIPDASKVALAVLCKNLVKWKFHLVDVQQSTAHMRSMGAEDIPRQQFLNELEQALQYPTRKGKWNFDG